MDQVSLRINTSEKVIEINGGLHPIGTINVLREMQDQFSIFTTSGKKVYEYQTYKETLLDDTEYNSTEELFEAFKTKLF